MVVFPLRLTDGFLGKRTFKSTVHPSSRFIRMGLPLFFNYYLFFLKIRNTRRKQVRSGRIVVRFFSSHTKKGAYGPKRVFGANVLQKKAEIKRLHFLKTTSGVRPPAVVLDRTSMRRVFGEIPRRCCRPLKNDLQRIQTNGTWDARRIRSPPPPYTMLACKYDNSDNAVNRRARKNHLSPTRGRR